MVIQGSIRVQCIGVSRLDSMLYVIEGRLLQGQNVGGSIIFIKKLKRIMTYRKFKE